MPSITRLTASLFFQLGGASSPQLELDNSSLTPPVFDLVALTDPTQLSHSLFPDSHPPLATTLFDFSYSFPSSEFPQRSTSRRRTRRSATMTPLQKPQKLGMDQLWIQHQRRNAKSTKSWACTLCPERRIFTNSEILWQHALQDHSDLLPWDESELRRYRTRFEAECLEKWLVLSLNKTTTITNEPPTSLSTKCSFSIPSHNRLLYRPILMASKYNQNTFSTSQVHPGTTPTKQAAIEFASSKAEWQPCWLEGLEHPKSWCQ